MSPLSNQKLQQQVSAKSTTELKVADAIFRYMTCVWGKKSGRKHKKWEGDAFMKVGSKTVILVDEDGKELGRGSGYKDVELQELGDGGRLGVGARDVEVTGSCSHQEWEQVVARAKRGVEAKVHLKTVAEVTPAQSRFVMTNHQHQPVLMAGGCNNTTVTELPVEAVTFRYFTCVWGKKSGRKHKKWEGDAFMKVGTKSVILVSEEGKEIGRSSGYTAVQLEQLEDGGRLGVGAKDVEISGCCSPQQWEEVAAKAKRGVESKVQSGETLSRTESLVEEVFVKHPSTPTFKPFKAPSKVGDQLNQYTAQRSVAPGVPMFDARREGAVVMPSPPPGHPLRIDEARLVEVVLDPFIGRHMRPHQKEGLLFLYQNVLGFTKIRSFDGEDVPSFAAGGGAILADEMGLGKTLQTVALVWTLLKQSPRAGAQV